jgi:hypothetical protein
MRLGTGEEAQAHAGTQIIAGIDDDAGSAYSGAGEEVRR